MMTTNLKNISPPDGKLEEIKKHGNTLNDRENQTESMKNHESTLSNHENQPKILKNHNIVNDG